MTPDEVGALDDWRVGQGLAAARPTGLLEGFCTRLEAIGVPLLRGSIGSDAFHPVVAGLGFVWRRDVGVRQELYARASEPVDLDAWR